MNTISGVGVRPPAPSHLPGLVSTPPPMPGQAFSVQPCQRLDSGQTFTPCSDALWGTGRPTVRFPTRTAACSSSGRRTTPPTTRPSMTSTTSSAASWNVSAAVRPLRAFGVSRPRPGKTHHTEIQHTSHRVVFIDSVFFASFLFVFLGDPHRRSSFFCPQELGHPPESQPRC